MEELSVLIMGMLIQKCECPVSISPRYAASYIFASRGRLTAGLLRASTIALLVGLTSTCFVNSMRM